MVKKKRSKVKVEEHKIKSNYFSWKKVECPALDDYVHFTREGWEHILKAKSRSRTERIERLRILPIAKKILTITTTLQRLEYKYVLNKHYKSNHYGFYAIMNGEKYNVVVLENRGKFYFYSISKVR